MNTFIKYKTTNIFLNPVRYNHKNYVNRKLNNGETITIKYYTVWVMSNQILGLVW